MADLDDVAKTVSEILSELRLHDQRSKFAVESISATQERIGHAVEKIAEVATALETYNAREAKRNGSGFKLTPQIAGWMIGGGFLLGVVLKGGAETVQLLLSFLNVKGG